MKKLCLTLVLALVAAVVSASAVAQAPATENKPVSGSVALGEVKVTATVENVDVAKRLITIKGQGGAVETFEVDPAVKNLAQVQKGDVIVIAYFESLAYEVRKSGAGPGVAASGGVVTAKPGEKPALGAKRQVTATVTITKIDAAAPSVTIKGPAGNEKTVKVMDPKKLEGVKVGDSVDLTYTEALAISVEKAPAKK
ncbi:hypothetical protein FBQ97_01495 [Acidobacteria bacterium ACD]|nr:MAG: hypothetical protein EDX89_09755 [Acidobacteriota bacterium]MCE7958073.1 hypothetical protein [Acidobacteria bacterium ACB2]MDL1948476.1 hypothetical protein [Acidobacteria bacterium ACD]